MEVHPAQANGVERVKRFVNAFFALHRQQPEKDKQNFDVAPMEKICGRLWMH